MSGQADIQIRQLRQQILKQKQTIEQQREELEREQQVIIELNCERDGFIQECAELRAIYKRLKDEFEEEVNKKIKDQNQTALKEKDEMKTAKAELSKRKDQIHDLQYEVEDLKDQCKMLKEQVKKENPSQDTRDQIAGYQFQKDQFRKELNEEREALNKLRNDMENILAENRVLRKLANVPDNYGFNLEEVKLAEQQKIEDFKKQVRYLEREVEELERERTQLRSRLRTATLLRKGNPQDQELEIQQESMGTKSQRQRLDNLLDQLEKFDRKGESGIVDQTVTADMIETMKKELTQHINSIVKQPTVYLGQEQGNENEIVYQDQGQQQQLGRKMDDGKQTYRPQEVADKAYAKHGFPPTPISGRYGDTENVSEGVTNRFGDKNQGQKIPVDTYDLYTENGFDQVAAKQEIATLQLMNLENMKIIKEKNKEYEALQEELQEIKEQCKLNLLVQDDLFQQHFSEKTNLEETLKKEQDKNNEQFNIIAQLQFKIKSYEDEQDEIKARGPETANGKLAEMTRNKAILEVNMIQLSRKYTCLKQEYDDLSEKYLEVDKTYSEKESRYVARIKDLIEWKNKAKVYLSIFLEQQKKSVPEDEYLTLQEKYQDIQSKYADIEIKHGEIYSKYAELRGAQREVDEKNEQIQVYQDEISEINVELEIVKKRLEDLDPLYKKYQECFQKLVNYCKENSFSPLETFQQFDKNKDGKLGKVEFDEVMKQLQIELHESELNTVFMFLDLDGSDTIEYPEFLRKLSRAGVKIRKKEEEVVYDLYMKIQQAGYTIKDIFLSFDKNFDNNITKEELGAGFENVGIQISKETLDYIFDLADMSRDGQINYDEFRSLFENIISDQIREELTINDDEIDIKKTLMIAIDTAARDMGLSLLDIYKIIDKNQDSQVTEAEFKQLLNTRLKLKLSKNQVHELFCDIDKDGDKYVDYNELLAYIRQAKIEYQKVEQAKKINKRIQRIKEGSGSFEVKQEGQGETGEISIVQKMERKMNMLELREKNCQQKVESQKKKLNHQSKEISNLEVKIQNLENEVIKAHKNYYESREKAAMYQEKVKCCVSKDESETMNADKQRMTIENQELKTALRTFKSLYQQSIDHIKVLKLTDEKRKHEVNTLKETRESIKNLQSESDDKALIGKMYHQLMICRWQQGEINKKYDTILDETRQDKIKLENQEFQINEQELELDNIHKEYYLTKRNKDQEIQKLKGKIIPTISLHRIEELHNKLSTIIQQKIDLEITNRRLKDQNNELQLKCDYFETSKEAMDEVAKELKTKNIDSHQQKIIEQGQQISELKLAEMKAKREGAMAREKEEYHQRINRQHTETIKVMETEIAESQLKFNEREEFWRKRVSDSERLFFKKQEEKAKNKKNVQENFDRLQRDRQQALRKQEIHSRQISLQSGKGDTSYNDQTQEVMQTEENERYSQQNIDPELNGSKVVSLENDLQGAQEQIADLKRTNKNLEIQIQQLQTQSTKQLSRQGRQTSNTKQDIDEITQKVVNEESEKFTRVAQQTIQTLQSLIDEKNQHLERRDELIQKMRKQFMQEKEKDIAEIRRLNNQIVNNNMGTIDRMQNSIVQHNGQVIESAEYWQDVGQLLHEKDKKLGTIVEDYEKEKVEHRKTKKEVKEQEIKMQALEAELQIEIQKNTTGKLTKEMDKLNRILREKDKELKKIQALVKDFKEESFKIAGEKQDQKSVMEKQHKEDKSKIATIQQQLVTALEDVKKTRTAMRQNEQELEELRVKGIEQKSLIRQLQDENKELKETAQVRGDKISNLQYEKSRQQAKERGGSKQQDQQSYNTKTEELNLQIKKLQDENKALQERLTLMQKQDKIQGSAASKMIDSDGTLQAPGMVFKDLPELIQSMNQFDKVAANGTLLQSVKTYDTQKKGEVKLTNFYKGLENAGLKLKKEDQKLINESDLIDNKNYVRLVPLYYMLRGGLTNQGMQSDKTQEKEAPGSKLTTRPQRQQREEINTRLSNQTNEQLEKKINLINKQLYEARKDKETLQKQLQNQREKYSKLEQDLLAIQKNPSRQTTQKRVSTTQANAISELKDTIYAQEDQLEKLKMFIFKKETENQKLGEEKTKLGEDLKQIKLDNQQLRQKNQGLQSQKIGSQQLLQENQSEKDEIIRNLKEKLQKQRNRDQELTDKYYDMIAENKELMYIKENFDIQIERQQRRIVELEEYKKLYQGEKDVKGYSQQPSSPPKYQSTLKRGSRIDR